MAATPNANWKKIIIALKMETTKGTYTAPASADFDIKFNEISVDPEFEMMAQEFASGRHSFGPATVGKSKVSFAAKAPMLLGATAGTPPKIGKALKVAGQLERTTLIFSGVLVTSNKINGNVNGVAISEQTFASDHATTMAAIATAIGVALAGATATVSGNTISIIHSSYTPIVLAGWLVTLGAGQATASYTVDYTPAASMDEVTASAWIQFITVSGNCITFKAKGVKAKLISGAEGIAYWSSFSFEGALVDVSDQTALVLTSPDTGAAPAFVGSVITANSVVQAVSKFSLDCGDTLEGDVDPGDSAGTGYEAFYIATRVPKLSWDPKIKLVASDPHYTRVKAGTEHAISIASATVAGLKWTYSMPAAQISALKAEKRGEMGAWGETLELHESAGNDAHKILQSA